MIPSAIKVIFLFTLLLFAYNGYSQIADTLYYPNGNILRVSVKKGLDSTETYFYESGLKKSVKNFRNGKLHGEQILWNNSGLKAYERHYLNGHKKGKWIEWNQSGQLIKKAFYVLQISGKDTTSVLHGKYEEYTNTGTLHIERFYKKGLLHKKEIYFTNAGIPVQENHYKIIVDSVKKSVKHGVQVSYYPSGKVKSKTEYKLGKKEGEQQEWQEDGTPIRLVTYGNDEINGLVKIWNRQGVLTGEYNQYSYKGEKGYTRTRFNGRYRSYYDNGNIKTEGSYSDFEKEGEWRHYCEKTGKINRFESYKDDKLFGYYKSINCETGNPYEEKNFTIITVDGEEKSVMHGDYISYHTNGNKRVTGSYKLGERHGVWKNYFADGALNMQMEYDEGLLSGQYITYLEDGRVNKIQSYTVVVKNGKRVSVEHGRQATWYDSGIPATESEMYKGRLAGLERRFYENGQLLSYQMPLVNIDKTPHIAHFQFYPDGALREVSLHRSLFPNYHFYPTGAIKHVEEPWNQSKSLKITWLPNGEPVSIMRRDGNTNKFNEYEPDKEAAAYRQFLKPLTEKGFVPVDSNFTGNWKFPPSSEKPLLSAEVINGRITGKFVIKSYENDTLAWYSFSDGRPNGEFAVFSGDGILRQKGEVADGVQVGTWTSYYANGELREKKVYSEAGELLEQTEGNENGHLKNYRNYKNGTSRSYYSDGTVLTEVVPVIVQDSSMFKITNYHENGRVKQEYHVVDNKSFAKQGEYLGFYEDGTPEYRLFYIDNKREGENVQYHPNGKIKLKGQFINDLAEGEWQLYDENGDLKEVIIYKNGVVAIREQPQECDCKPAEQEKLNFAQRLLHWASYENVKKWAFPFHAPLDTFYEKLYVRRHSGNNRSAQFRLMAFQDVYVYLPDSTGIKLLLNPCESKRQISFFEVYAQINPENRDQTQLRIKTNSSAIVFEPNWLTAWNKEENVPIIIDGSTSGARLVFDVSAYNYSRNGLEAEGSGNFCFPYSRIRNTSFFIDLENARLLLNNMKNELDNYLRYSIANNTDAEKILKEDYLRIGREYTGLYIPEATINLVQISGNESLNIEATGKYLLLNNSYLQGMLSIPVQSVKGGTVTIASGVESVQLEVNNLLSRIEANKAQIIKWWLADGELLVYFKLPAPL